MAVITVGGMMGMVPKKCSYFEIERILVIQELVIGMLQVLLQWVCKSKKCEVGGYV